MGFVIRSPRERSTWRAVLVQGDVHSTGLVRDVSTTGLFLDAPARLRVGDRVAVVPLMGESEGTRLVAEVARIAGRDGLALRFLGDLLPGAPTSRTPLWMRKAPLELLPANAPELLLADADGVQGTDDVDVIAPPVTAPEECARYLVRPPDLERLREFESWHLGASGTMLFAHDLRAPGEGVAVIVVHPVTQVGFSIPAVVVNAHHEKPHRIDVHFLGVDARLRTQFRSFVETGRLIAVLPAADSAATDDAHDARQDAQLDQNPQLDRLEGDNAALRVRVGSLEEQNEMLRGRVFELEAELDEAERAERALFARLHELEARRR